MPDSNCSAQELLEIIEMAPSITYKAPLDPQQSIAFISRGIGRILGYDHEDIVNQPGWWLSHIHPEDRNKFEERQRCFSLDELCDEIMECEYRFLHNDGYYVWLADKARVMISSYNESLYLLGTVVDISQIVELQTRIKMLAAVTPGVLYQFQINEENGNYCFPFASSQIENLFGVTPEVAAQDAAPVFAAIHPDDVMRVYQSVENAHNAQSEWKCEFRVTNQDKTRWIYGHSIPLPQNEGRYTWSGLLIDISEQKHLEFRLHKESTIDPLTGCYNRRYFLDYLHSALETISSDANEHLSVIAIDFDNFKAINDEYGHGTGDEVLCQVTKHIDKHIRKSDCLARMGGEEFILLLPDVSYGDALGIAEKLRISVANLPIEFDGHEIFITITLGVASTESGFYTSDELLRFSDRALYKGKANGRNCVA